MAQSPGIFRTRVGVSFYELQKPARARGNGSMALNRGSLQPREQAFIQRLFLLPFHNRYSKLWGGRRALCIHFNAALRKRPPRANEDFNLTHKAPTSPHHAEKSQIKILNSQIHVKMTFYMGVNIVPFKRMPLHHPGLYPDITCEFEETIWS
jgi:hypothetical protein